MTDTSGKPGGRRRISPITLGRSAIDAIMRVKNRRTAIRALMALDDYLLRDIGMTRSQIPLVVDGLLDRGSPRLESINGSAGEPKEVADSGSAAESKEVVDTRKFSSAA